MFVLSVAGPYQCGVKAVTWGMVNTIMEARLEHSEKNMDSMKQRMLEIKVVMEEVRTTQRS